MGVVGKGFEDREERGILWKPQRKAACVGGVAGGMTMALAIIAEEGKWLGLSMVALDLVLCSIRWCG